MFNFPWIIFYFLLSRETSRPSTPIKSDTEYEVERQRQEHSDEAGQVESEESWNWTWGQLPTPPVKNSNGKVTDAGGVIPEGADESSATSEAGKPGELTSIAGDAGAPAIEDELKSQQQKKNAQAAAKKEEEEQEGKTIVLLQPFLVVRFYWPFM